MRRMESMNEHCSPIAVIADLTKEQWLEIRMSGLGGSDIGAIMGTSKWKSPLSVYMDKIGQGQPVEESEPMYWGNVLEEVVAQEFSKRTGKTVEPYPYMLRSNKYPWMLANLDRIIVNEDAGLECKTAHANKLKEWEDGKVPDDYLLQCYHYMIVTGFKKWHIACLVGGQRFINYEIEYNEMIAKNVISIGEQFWKQVTDRVAPSAWAQDVDLLSELYKGTDNNRIYLGEDAQAFIDIYTTQSDIESRAKQEKDAAKARLCELIGDHTAAMCGGREITWKPTVTNRFDSKAFQTDLPDLYKQYSKPSSSRRFLIKKGGE